MSPQPEIRAKEAEFGIAEDLSEGWEFRSIGHGADFFFDRSGVHHDDGVPRTPVEEAAIGAFAEALFATDAEDGIDLDAAKGRMVFVRDPEHAVFDGTVFDARGRASAAGAAFGDDSKFFRFLLPGGGPSSEVRASVRRVPSPVL